MQDLTCSRLGSRLVNLLAKKLIEEHDCSCYSKADQGGDASGRAHKQQSEKPSSEWELLQRIHEAVQGPRRHIAACAPCRPAYSGKEESLCLLMPEAWCSRCLHLCMQSTAKVDVNHFSRWQGHSLFDGIKMVIIDHSSARNLCWTGFIY